MLVLFVRSLLSSDACLLFVWLVVLEEKVVCLIVCVVAWLFCVCGWLFGCLVECFMLNVHTRLFGSRIL